ncbi:GTPase [Phycisphaerales bacterium ac7]
MPEQEPALTFALATAPRAASHTATAAISIVDLRGDPSALPRALGIGSLPDPGQMRLARIPGIDEALICRIARHHTQIHTHAGPFVIEKLAAAFVRAGITHRQPTPATQADLLDHWLVHTPSRRALDLLLAQPRLRETPGTPSADPRLDRLLLPPLVVAVGRPNAGKSSLLNALARRSIAIVSETPGTTRDSVGALLDLDGLAVRWLDLPGIRDTDDPIEAEAIRRAEGWVARADAVIHCTEDPADTLAGRFDPALTVLTKADLRAATAPAGTIACSARTGEGIPELARAIRQSLVPDAILTTDTLWILPDPA